MPEIKIPEPVCVTVMWECPSDPIEEIVIERQKSEIIATITGKKRATQILNAFREAACV